MAVDLTIGGLFQYSACVRRLLYLFIGFVLSLAPIVGIAHMVGQSWEKQVGAYVIDAGCDQLEFVPKQENFCSFTLIENAGSWDWEIARHDTVDVEVSRVSKNETIFKKSLTPEPQVMTFTSFSFPRGGDYNLYLRFSSRGAVLAEADFPIVVQGDNWLTLRKVGAMIAFFLLGACAIALGIATVRARPRP